MSTAVTEPAEPAVAETPARRGTAAIVGLGVALLAAAAMVSTVYTRQDGDLDWSVYAIGLGATAALLLVMLVGAVGHDLGAKRALTGFPGAVGAIAAGAMVGVGFEDENWVAWAVGGVILAVAVIAYLLGRAGAPTVAAIAGLVVLYGKAVEEIVDVDDDQTLIYGGAIIVVFVVAVTAIGWLLPHRALVGVTVGAGGVVALVGLLAIASIAQSFVAFTPLEPGATPPSGPGGPGDLENDVYVVLGYAAALVLLWTLAAWASGSSGFRVLAVVLSAVIVPMAMTTLAVDHPTWWGVAVAAAGAVLLLLALLAGRRAHREAAPPPSTEPPEPFFGSPPPPPTPAEGTPAPAGDKSGDAVVAPANPTAPTDPTDPTNPPPPPDPKDRRPS